MGVDVSEQRKTQGAEADGQDTTTRARRADTPDAPAAPQGIVALTLHNLQVGIQQLQWREVVLFGVVAGLLMPLSFLQANLLSIVAGLIPVGTGLLLGRRVKGHYGLHGFVTGLIAALIGIIGIGVLIFLTPYGPTAATSLGTPAPNTTAAPISPLNLWLQLGGFIAFSLITFCTFGTTMAGRSEERNRQTRKEVETRGGRLERPNAIRTADDVHVADVGAELRQRRVQEERLHVEGLSLHRQG